MKDSMPGVNPAPITNTNVGEKCKVSANFSTAKGHTCAINRFDEATVMIPFNATELDRLRNAMERRMYALRSTNDYPEKAEDEATMYNLQIAAWMLTRK